MEKQLKKEEIISAAKKLIIEKGYRKTSVEDITKEIGIAKGSFYTYFKSKDSLMLELMEERGEKFNKNLSEILKNSKNLDKTIREYIKHYFIMPTKDLEFILVMLKMMGSFDSIGKKILERLEKNKIRRKNEVIKILKKNIDEVDASNEKDLERYGILIFEMINTFFINNFFPSESGFVEATLEDIKKKALKVDIDYETEFMSKRILKMIKK